MCEEEAAGIIVWIGIGIRVLVVDSIDTSKWTFIFLIIFKNVINTCDPAPNRINNSEQKYNLERLVLRAMVISLYTTNGPTVDGLQLKFQILQGNHTRKLKELYYSKILFEC